MVACVVQPCSIGAQVVRIVQGCTDTCKPWLMKHRVAAVPTIAANNIVVNDADATDGVDQLGDRSGVQALEVATGKCVLEAQRLQFNRGTNLLTLFDRKRRPNVLSISKKASFAMLWDSTILCSRHRHREFAVD